MRLFVCLLSLFLISTAVAQTPAPIPDPAPRPELPEFLKQGQQFLRDGNSEAAIALYRQQLQAAPNSLLALNALGSALDLAGRGQEARTYFDRAINAADNPDSRASAYRAMAMSWAFEGSCDKTLEYQQKAFDHSVEIGDSIGLGNLANEGARVCLDAGDVLPSFPKENIDTAYQWYQKGHDSALKNPRIKPEDVDLWNFRWEHAQARIAARCGNREEAAKHVAAAKAILDKGTNPGQAEYLPYLEGYVAFFAHDYKAALAQFSKANQNDAFIQCFLGQTYEALGDRLKTQEFYLKASKVTSHNPVAAYVIPFTRKKLAANPSNPKP